MLVRIRTEDPLLGVTSTEVLVSTPKVPPGIAGHPVCLDTLTEIHLRLLSIVGIVLKHSPYRSLTLSAPDELCERPPNTRYVLRSAECMLLSLRASTLIAAHGRYNAGGSLKRGSSDALWREEQSAVAHVRRTIVGGGMADGKSVGLVFWYDLADKCCTQRQADVARSDERDSLA
jgi:hypothetical protein